VKRDPAARIKVADRKARVIKVPGRKVKVKVKAKDTPHRDREAQAAAIKGSEALVKALAVMAVLALRVLGTKAQVIKVPDTKDLDPRGRDTKGVPVDTRRAEADQVDILPVARGREDIVAGLGARGATKGDRAEVAVGQAALAVGRAAPVVLGCRRRLRRGSPLLSAL
jgi:hypothetical protein